MPLPVRLIYEDDTQEIKELALVKKIAATQSFVSILGISERLPTGPFLVSFKNRELESAFIPTEWSLLRRPNFVQIYEGPHVMYKNSNFSPETIIDIYILDGHSNLKC